MTSLMALRRAAQSTQPSAIAAMTSPKAAEVGLAVVQFWGNVSLHQNPQPPRGRIVMLPSGST